MGVSQKSWVRIGLTSCLLAASSAFAPLSAEAATARNAGCAGGIINTSNVYYGYGSVDYYATCRGGYFYLNYSHSRWISPRTHCRYWDLTKVGGCSTGGANDWISRCKTFTSPGTISDPNSANAYWDAEVH